MNLYAVLADVVVFVHLVYMGFVIFGQLLVMIGWPLQWRWIRNPWFRGIHLFTILIVAFEAVIDFECPLTTLDRYLRRLAGQEGVREISFTGQIMSDIMYAGGDHWEQYVNTTFYIAAAIVVATLLLVPPRWHKDKSQAA